MAMAADQPRQTSPVGGSVTVRGPESRDRPVDDAAGLTHLDVIRGHSQAARERYAGLLDRLGR
ncbi:hypothetical protein [Nakamurella flava]|uniref:hypothetical protein n=1 Tax=Nakamurella flava TaxID=2576308 RepID=UPI001F0E8416|nr:hypothetical protein [Nakamurella flava]